jgi:hypothetical protein
MFEMEIRTRMEDVVKYIKPVTATYYDGRIDFDGVISSMRRFSASATNAIPPTALHPASRMPPSNHLPTSPRSVFGITIAIRRHCGIQIRPSTAASSRRCVVALRLLPRTISPEILSPVCKEPFPRSHRTSQRPREVVWRASLAIPRADPRRLQREDIVVAVRPCFDGERADRYAERKEGSLCGAPS